MADDLNLTVKVNAETGQLEAVGGKLKETGKHAEDAKGKFGQLSQETAGLLKNFIGLASAGAVLAFFRNAVKGAEEQNEAFRRLQFTLDSVGQSWSDNEERVRAWTLEIAKSSRFTDGEAITTLERLARVTGDVTQAQKAAQVAFGLAVASGKDLNFVTQKMADLINGEQGALLELKREFGAFLGEAESTQDALDILAEKYSDTAFTQKGLTEETARLKNEWSLFMDQIGNSIIPGLTPLVSALRNVFKVIDNIGSVVAAQAALMFETISGTVRSLMALVRGNFGEAKSIAMETSNAIREHILNTQKDITDTWTQEEERRNSEIAAAGEQRLVINDALRTKENIRLEQMESELDQKMASLEQNTLTRKKNMLDAEVAARRKKIDKEFKDELTKQKALQKLQEFEKASYAALQREEVELKLQASLQIASLAVQTLQTINSLGEKGSEAEKTRAKALLALQQSIAIGWAWVNAMKAGGPFAVGLAAATTALIVAQFAQQLKAIDRASAQEKAGIDAINVREPVPGIDLDAGIGGGGGDVEGIGVVGGGGGGFRSGSGGGGGGGGQTVINVGGITVNFDVDKLSTDNVDAVMMRMYERIRAGTVEGIQLALALDKAATKNSNLAS